MSLVWLWSAPSGGAEAGFVPRWPPEGVRGGGVCPAGAAGGAGRAGGGAEAAGWDRDVGQRAAGGLGEGR